MVEQIILNETPIEIEYYKEDNNYLICICVDFKVTSEDYHKITTLLYEGEFDIQVPGKGLSFRGKIVNYATSMTNLYEVGQVGDFKLCLQEVKEK